MDGRFPFDATGGRGQAAFNAAQVRAALGLTSGVDEATVYLQAQRQQQDLQRDLQLRQLLLQERLEQQMKEQQLRAIGDQLQDFPDLQQHYQSLLRLNQPANNRQREQVSQATQLQYADELLRQQQQQQLQLQHAPFISQHVDAAASIASPQQAANVASIPAAGLRALQTGLQGTGLEQQLSLLDSVTASTASAHPQLSLKRSASDSVNDTDPASKRARVDSPANGVATSNENAPENAFDAIVQAASLALPSPMKGSQEDAGRTTGTVEDLLLAAADKDKIDDAAEVIHLLQKAEWSGAENGPPVQNASRPDHSDVLVSIKSPRFKSVLPRLPEEPLASNESESMMTSIERRNSLLSRTESHPMDILLEASTSQETVPVVKGADKRKKASATHDTWTPVTIDTWWPSTKGARRERRAAGETSDEDSFDDGAAARDGALFRANSAKIRSRLSRDIEPGVLEKISHCRIHRIRTKRNKHSTAPEFLFCWQVSEMYPNEAMLCCSRCGTWRHAACGGHFEAVRSRESSKKPFKAVCEHCHEEESFLRNYPAGAKRIERQRNELLRRALATSAVMRQAAFAKHGKSFEWPLGSVNEVNISAHARGIHARHDKAAKQWAEMGQRLSKTLGHRSKERSKGRTKELERLMQSIEDAEAYTERHNMIHFLLRDTRREKPVGYDHDFLNIFDPSESSKSSTRAIDAKQCCARQGCCRHPRFDSLFCSDACGLSAVETDLLQSLFEAGEIHPAALRA